MMMMRCIIITRRRKQQKFVNFMYSLARDADMKRKFEFINNLYVYGMVHSTKTKVKSVI